MRVTAVFLLVALGYAQDVKNEKKPQTPQQRAVTFVDKGRALILQEKPQAAIDQLQKAIGQLQKLLVKGLVRWLPKKFGDWERGKVQTDTGSWGSGEQAMQWNRAHCVYTSKDGRRKIDASISTSPQQIQGSRRMAEMYMNEQMVKLMNNDNTKVEVIKAGEWIGWVVSQRGRDATLVAMAKKVMFSLRINSDDLSVVKKFWEIFDRKGCAAANK